MLRIGFSGVPSSGKTTMARALAAELKTKYRVIELVSEYARMYKIKYGPIATVQDQFRILDKQVEWEEEIPITTDVLITDSPVFLGFLYALDLRDPHDKKDTMWVNDLFRKMSNLNSPARYDFIFNLKPVLVPVDDSVRDQEHLSPEWREDKDLFIKMLFKMFPPRNFIELQTLSVEERLGEILPIL